MPSLVRRTGNSFSTRTARSQQSKQMCQALHVYGKLCRMAWHGLRVVGWMGVVHVRCMRSPAREIEDYLI